MFYGFYGAASGMLNKQRALNVIGNNLTNVKTPGFRTGRLVTKTFDQELQVRIENGKKTPIGSLSPMSVVEEIDTLYDQAPLEETDRPFDMAIEGFGFFKLRSSEGEEFLTRNGNFSRDEEGYLVLDGVGRLQGQNGDIFVPNANFTVLESGTILDENGDRIDKIPIFEARAENLKKHPNGSYVFSKKEREQNEGEIDGEEFEEELEPSITKNAKIRQGILERSNVDINNEMARLIETQRAFQSCTQALKTIDQINQKTVSIASI